MQKQEAKLNTHTQLLVLKEFELGEKNIVPKIAKLFMGRILRSHIKNPVPVQNFQI